MKFLTVVAVVSLAFSTILPFIFGEHYRMEIVEKGTAFTQEIEVDEEKNIEIFRVPAHNDVDGADFYHDFKMRLTVTKIPIRKECHISQMDSSLSSPRKLKADIKRTSSRRGQLPVITQQSLVMVTGPANRRLLTKEILDFCGALPIYNTELVSNPSYENGTATFIRTRRRKRQVVNGTIIVDFKSCLESKEQDMFKYVKEGNCYADSDAWDIRCKMIPKMMECFYYATCIKLPRRYDWNCTTVHRGSANPFCCDPVCQEKPTTILPQQ